MRMWMLPTEILCKNHLLGEHKEIHTQLAFVLKHYNPSGWIRQEFIFPSYLLSRHKELIKELKARKYNHQSEITTLQFKEFISILAKMKIENYKNKVSKSNRIKNLKDLLKRCPICSARHYDYIHKEDF